MSMHSLLPSALRQLCLSAALLSLLSGCATQEVAPPTDEELDRVAKALLKDAIYTQALLTQCADVSPTLKGYSDDLRILWEGEHGAAIAGADARFSDPLESEVIEYQDQTLALSAVRLLHQAQSRASEELRLPARSHRNQAIVCERRLEQLEENLEQRPYLQDDSQKEQMALKALASDTEEKLGLGQVPSLAQNIPADTPPGRRFHSVEEQANRECADNDVIVIENHWPHEAYGIYCESEAALFVACEWGECQVR